MGLETVTYIADLNPLWPLAGDAVSQGDDHVRAVKKAIQGSFPNLGSGAVTGTYTDLNVITGIGAIANGSVLKKSSNVVAVATAGTDYVAPGTSTTFTAAQTFTAAVSCTSTFGVSGTATLSGNATVGGTFGVTGNSTLSGTLAVSKKATFTATDAAVSAVIPTASETVTISASAPASTTTFDACTQQVQYYTSNATTNWTLNIRGSSTATLNSVMSIGQAITIALLTTQGGTSYYQTALTIDGNSVTPVWQGGTAPAYGNQSSIDCYQFTVIKTDDATFKVLASQNKYA